MNSEGSVPIIEKPKPKIEMRIMVFMDETSAIAIPTSSDRYILAAIIHKMKPKPALDIDESSIKREFLNKASLK